MSSEDEHLRWRTSEELPPGALLICSPYDVEARYSKKRSTEWTGYKAHLTEACEQDQPHLITHVETTVAMTLDGAVVETMYQSLAEKELRRIRTPRFAILGQTLRLTEAL